MPIVKEDGYRHGHHPGTETVWLGHMLMLLSQTLLLKVIVNNNNNNNNFETKIVS